MKYLMFISYDGSKFHGFQRQKDIKNVQGYLESSLSNILNEKLIIKGAGRTDRGVHAYNQAVHFETTKDITKLKRTFNKMQDDIKIKQIKKVADDFHARHSVKSKTYLYKLDLSNNRDINYYGKEKNNIDIARMRKASKLLIGTHNFKNFVAGERLNYDSTILDIKIYRINKLVYFKFKGIGFYRYMVRNLVGALVEVGKLKTDENTIKDMLELKTEKRLPTASPNGLYLYSIKY